MDWVTLIVAIVSSSALTTVIQGVLNKRKIWAEVSKTNTETDLLIDERYNKLLKKFEERIRELERENKDLYKELNEIRIKEQEIKKKIDHFSFLLTYFVPPEKRTEEPFKSIIQALK